ncbi:hypothetical protein [Tahibacter amnicola]|uniref:Uncharacterized protein n=1 Tax=Tahibacter amnicola TaxID=2976241 RepID=A0ABY6BFI2_9GAMM|nr:hypothetical protein [Tahibacter amnicola]UXI68580.1 hypothetical protein N4264_02700 [Tahibacter amnicola]
MRSTRLFCIGVLLSTVACGPAMADSSDSKVIIKNLSHFAVHELYFSPTEQREWGPDQLGSHTIGNGETFTLNGVPCDSYDVRVVDEDGDECIIEDVALCADKDKWVINDNDLLGCQAATQGD